MITNHHRINNRHWLHPLSCLYYWNPILWQSNFLDKIRVPQNNLLCSKLKRKVIISNCSIIQIVLKINSNFQIASHHWLKINLTMVIRRIWDWSNNGCWSSMSNNGYSWSSSVWSSSWGSCYSCFCRWTPLKGISTIALFAVTRRPLIGYNTNWIMSTNTWTRVLTLIIKAC